LLLIATPDRAVATIVPRVYDVADLVLSTQTPGMSRAFGGVTGGGGGSLFDQAKAISPHSSQIRRVNEEEYAIASLKFGIGMVLKNHTYL
jgi:hypothetical protein